MDLLYSFCGGAGHARKDNGVIGEKKRVCLLNNSEIKLHCVAKMTAFVLCLCIFVGSEVCRLL